MSFTDNVKQAARDFISGMGYSDPADYMRDAVVNDVSSGGQICLCDDSHTVATGETCPGGMPGLTDVATVLVMDDQGDLMAVTPDEGEVLASMASGFAEGDVVVLGDIAVANAVLDQADVIADLQARNANQAGTISDDFKQIDELETVNSIQAQQLAYQDTIIENLNDDLEGEDAAMDVMDDGLDRLQAENEALKGIIARQGQVISDLEVELAEDDEEEEVAFQAYVPETVAEVVVIAGPLNDMGSGGGLE
jgi:hypothetical protein